MVKSVLLRLYHNFLYSRMKMLIFHKCEILVKFILVILVEVEQNLLKVLCESRQLRNGFLILIVRVCKYVAFEHQIYICDI
mgnify:CR=1 FL=1